MRPIRWVGIAVALPLLLATVAVAVRHEETDGRAAALVRAVSSGNVPAAERLLAQGGEANTLVAWRPFAFGSMLAGYRSLLLIAEENGDAKMEALLRSHGGTHVQITAAIPAMAATPDRILSADRDPLSDAPLPHWAQLALRLKEHWRLAAPGAGGPPRVDPAAPDMPLWPVTLAPAVLILGGALRILGLGLPRNSDVERTRRSLAQGAAVMLLGAALTVAVAWLLP